MENQENKQVTVDDLARMTKKGFDELHQRFDRVDLRLESIDKKLEGVVYRNEFEELQERVKTIEEALAIKHPK